MWTNGPPDDIQVGRIVANKEIGRRSACCFTGHRDPPAGMADYLSGRVKGGIGYFHGRGVTAFLAGNAHSFNALAAMAVIESRVVHGDIRLVLVLPAGIRPGAGRRRIWKSMSSSRRSPTA